MVHEERQNCAAFSAFFFPILYDLVSKLFPHNRCLFCLPQTFPEWAANCPNPIQWKLDNGTFADRHGSVTAAGDGVIEKSQRPTSRGSVSVRVFDAAPHDKQSQNLRGHDTASSSPTFQPWNRTRNAVAAEIAHIRDILSNLGARVEEREARWKQQEGSRL